METCLTQQELSTFRFLEFAQYLLDTVLGVEHIVIVQNGQHQILSYQVVNIGFACSITVVDMAIAIVKYGEIFHGCS